jgi:hypothetical protein
MHRRWQFWLGWALLLFAAVAFGSVIVGGIHLVLTWPPQK